MISSELGEIQHHKARFQKSKAARVNKQAEINEMRTFVNKIIQRGKPWTDPDFPPSAESLFDPMND